MAARLFLLCLAWLLAFPSTALDDGRRECRAAPDYSCLIDCALATAESDDNPHTRVSLLLAIGEAQAKAGDPMGALATADRIEDPYARIRALAVGAAAQARAGDPEGALETAGKIEDPYQEARALRDIAAEQARAGDMKGGLATAGEIERASFKAEALRDIAETQARTGDAKGALATLVAALAAAGKIEDAEGRARALMRFAAVLAGWKRSGRGRARNRSLRPSRQPCDVARFHAPGKRPPQARPVPRGRKIAVSGRYLPPKIGQQR